MGEEQKSEDIFGRLQYNMIRGKPLVNVRASASDLSKAHSTYKIGYDNIVSLLDRLPTDDIANFLGYCEAWAKAIEGHHDSEVSQCMTCVEMSLTFGLFRSGVMSGSSRVSIPQPEDGLLQGERRTYGHPRVSRPFNGHNSRWKGKPFDISCGRATQFDGRIP